MYYSIISIVCLSCCIGLLTTCSENDDFILSDLKQKTVKERLKMSTEEFIYLFNNRNSYKSVTTVISRYEKTFTPRVVLEEKNTRIRSNVSVVDRELSPTESLFALLNENNVFQYGDYVVFISPELNNIKLLYAKDYDSFIKKQPDDIFSIPKNLLLKEILLDNSISNIPRLKSGSECDDCIDVAACVYCGVGVIASACGIPAGLLELAACIKCAMSLMDYSECMNG